MKAVSILGKVWLLVAVFCCCAGLSLAKEKVTSDGYCKGIYLGGKVRVVDSFPDLRVQVVDSFPDLRVQVVDAFPDKPGEWQFVDSFPDFTVQFVDSFPDLRIQFVQSFPGVQ